MRITVITILASLLLIIILVESAYAQMPVYYGRMRAPVFGGPFGSSMSAYASYPVFPQRYSRYCGAPIYILDQWLPPGYIVGQPFFNLPSGLGYCTTTPTPVYVMHYNPNDYYYGPRF